MFYPTAIKGYANFALLIASGSRAGGVALEKCVGCIVKIMMCRMFRLVDISWRV